MRPICVVLLLGVAVNAFSGTTPYYFQEKPITTAIFPVEESETIPDIVEVATIAPDLENQIAEMQIEIERNFNPNQDQGRIIEGAAESHEQDLALTIQAILDHNKRIDKRKAEMYQRTQGREIVVDRPRLPPRAVEGAASTSAEDLKKTLQVVFHQVDLDRTREVLGFR